MTAVADPAVTPHHAPTPARIAEEVLAVRGVRALGEGGPDMARGSAPRGVEVLPGGIRVHVVVGYPDGFPLPRLIDRVRRRLEPLVMGGSVSVVIEAVDES